MLYIRDLLEFLSVCSVSVKKGPPFGHESELPVCQTRAEPRFSVQETRMPIITTIALAQSQYDNLGDIQVISNCRTDPIHMTVHINSFV